MRTSPSSPPATVSSSEWRDAWCSVVSSNVVSGVSAAANSASNSQPSSGARGDCGEPLSTRGDRRRLTRLGDVPIATRPGDGACRSCNSWRFSRLFSCVSLSSMCSRWALCVARSSNSTDSFCAHVCTAVTREATSVSTWAMGESTAVVAATTRSVDAPC